MAKTRIVLNRKGVGSLLKSKEMMAVCLEHANATCQSAGGVGYEVTTFT